MSLRSATKKVLNHLLAPLNVHIARGRYHKRRTTADITLSLLLGKPQIFALDVGASRGDFAASVLDIAPEASIICVEPIPEHQTELRERFEGKDVRILRTAVSDYDGETVFHEVAAQDSSSILPLGRHSVDFPEESQEVATYSVPVARLDTLLPQHDPSNRDIDLIKLDVQGAEYPVLVGAEQSLARCKNVLIEMSLRPLYEGQHSFEDIVLFMHSHGFRMIDYIEGARSRTTGELVQMDFLYQRTS